ncbi:hypothetical protein NliqN6_2325 [Naganishia liquefaciens]|uniref:Protein CPL1-like domain-containing protein n=1 Tax=Naganishia liquefaciens TaxID=104408 RepID=A0A8H3TS63_9TREE|nr:hypothetical protein NliqN6_2325 [Naganishia liquefaciens]
MVRLTQQLFTLFAALSVILMAAANPIATTTTHVSPRRDTSGGLMTRGQIKSGTLCDSVAIVIQAGYKKYTILDNICICTQDGYITDDSLQNLNGQIQAGGILGNLFNFVIQLIGGHANFQKSCKEAAEGAVRNKHSTCPYPANSSPVCKGGNTLPNSKCHFKCKNGYKLCGTSYCIPNHSSCVSGMPGRRSLELPISDNTQNLCPPGLEACYTSDVSMKFGRPVGWECVDTSSDVESCGGCEWPVAGQAQGQDCSDMSGVSRVSCNRGQCQAETCMRGFEKNGTECVESAKRSFWQAI